MRYAREPAKEASSAKAHGRDLRVHFKCTRETAMAIKGMELNRAKKYLEDVIAHKDIVPFRRFRKGPGHHAQCKNHTWPVGRWPEKSCRFIQKLLQNAEANAESKGLDSENWYITHIQVNRAPKIRRRTYRAHGRINPYMCSPCHVELFLEQKEKDNMELHEKKKKFGSKKKFGFKKKFAAKKA